MDRIRINLIDQRLKQYNELFSAVLALDLSDDWTLEQSEPDELISCTRPVEDWRRIRKTLDTIINWKPEGLEV